MKVATLDAQPVTSKIQDYTLMTAAFATSFLLTSPAFAANTSLKDAYSADQSKAGSLTSSNGGNADAGLGIVYKLLAGIFIVIGLWLVGTGLMKVKKAANSDGRESQSGGWISVGIGGALASASYVLWTMSKTVENVTGAGG